VPTPAPESADPGYNQRELQPTPSNPPSPPQPEAENAPRLLNERQAARSVTPGKQAQGGSNAENRQKSNSTKTAGRKTFDVSSKLGKLEENPIRQTSADEPASNNEAAGKSPQKSSRLQWTESKKIATHESNANPSAAESDRPAAGWQGVQR
jgi:hypothetical protein